MRTNLFTSIVLNLTDGIYVIQDGRAIFLNDRFGAIFGYESVEGLIDRDMYAEVYPDRLSVDLFRHVHEQLLTGERSSVSWGQPSARRDGSTFWIEVEARLIEVDGRPAIFGTFLDRTDCKLIGEAMHATQETLRLLLDAMEDRVYVVTDDYRIVYANRKMREGVAGDIEKDFCYQVCRGQQTRCEDCCVDEAFFETEKPLHKEFYNEVTRLWYSVIELPVRMPGIDRRTKLAVARDVTVRKEAENKVRALSRKLLKVQEDERKHLSRELHDDLAQRLNAAKLIVDVLAEDLAQAPVNVADRMRHLSEVLKDSVQSIRGICAGLRPSPLERLGLVDAIRHDCENVSAHHGLQVRVSAHGMEAASLPQEVEITLYRVFQEALHNVVKHARAGEVQVHLVISHPVLRMRISDNGTGFEPAAAVPAGKGGLGLVGMAERVELLNGSFQVTSRPGGGTRIAVEIPIA